MRDCDHVCVIFLHGGASLEPSQVRHNFIFILYVFLTNYRIFTKYVYNEFVHPKERYTVTIKLITIN